MAKKKTVLDFFKMKEAGEKFSYLVLYDFTFAMLAEQSGADMILIGDSMGNVLYGFDGTVPVTLDQIIAHAGAVRRGAPNTFIVGDMPFLSYSVSIPETVANAGRIYKEAHVDAVKMEGGRRIVPHIKAVVDAGMVVHGHIGITPQSVSALGGFGAQGRTLEDAQALLEDALALEAAGVTAIVLEGLPAETGKLITERLSIPTVGTGAGPDCDAQCLNYMDVLGIFQMFKPKFVKRYASLEDNIKSSFTTFFEEIRSGAYPAPEHCYGMRPGEKERLEKWSAENKK
ncbi:MAG: 3-methyl-2-oxobutanoate hydroxymethyltransferase [Dehalococcoidia bacterium]|nr:3-methyl-2-oxobutanoate hydroxymethyltransferase [Dehalococcoidia bacterium]